MSDARPLCSFFGHHKCATQWIKGVLADICKAANLRMFEVGRVDESDFGSLRDLLDCFRPDLLVYFNADIGQVRAAGNLRGFHVVRDPRDLIVSAYFSHLHSHPLETWCGLAEHRRRLQALNKTEGLLLEMDFSRRVLEEMRAWDYSRPDVLELRMEDLIAAPEVHFTRVIEHVGLTSLPPGTRAERLSSAVRIACSRIRRAARRVTGLRLPSLVGGESNRSVSVRWSKRTDPYQAVAKVGFTGSGRALNCCHRLLLDRRETQEGTWHSGSDVGNGSWRPSSLPPTCRSPPVIRSTRH